MIFEKPALFQSLVKALIGWTGLVYFFFTSYEDWGEAVGLTLFFATGQLQTAVKPPINVITPELFAPEILLETWRITIGVATFVYYFYVVLYLGKSVTIYISTVCLSLLWESQIVDDVINLVTSWVSHDLVNSTMRVTERLSSLKQRAIKACAKDIVQDFLCVLCKLYKHLNMNCIIIIDFLLAQVRHMTGKTLSIVKREYTDEKQVQATEKNHFLASKDHIPGAASKYVKDLKDNRFGRQDLFSYLGVTTAYRKTDDGCNMEYRPTVLPLKTTNAGYRNQTTSNKINRGATSSVF